LVLLTLPRASEASYIYPVSNSVDERHIMGHGVQWIYTQPTNPPNLRYIGIPKPLSLTSYPTIALNTPGMAEWASYDESAFQRSSLYAHSIQWVNNFEIPYAQVYLGSDTFIGGAQEGSENWLNYRYRSSSSDPWQYVWAQFEFHEEGWQPSGDVPARATISYVYGYDFFTLKDAIAIKNAGPLTYWKGSSLWWGDASNWIKSTTSGPAGIPDSFTNVLIGENREVVVAARMNATAGNIQLGGLSSGGGSLAVETDGVLTVRDTILVDSGILQVANGGKLTARTIKVMNTGRGKLNRFEVSEQGSVVEADLVTIGASYPASIYDTGKALLSIDWGGSIKASKFLIGSDTTSTGQVDVKNSGRIHATNEMTIGEYGTGVVEISNSGRLQADNGLILGKESDSSGRLNLHFGGLAEIHGDLLVGHKGRGDLSIYESQLDFQGLLAFGTDSGGSGWGDVAQGSLYIRGDQRRNNLIVGRNSFGQLLISNQGVVQVDGNIVVGESITSSGTIIVSDRGSSLSTHNGNLYIGVYGSGSVTVKNGAALNVREIYMAQQYKSSAKLYIGEHGQALGQSLLSQDIHFGAGQAEVYFRQANDLTYSGSLIPSNTYNSPISINKVGTGKLIMTGNSGAFTGTTRLREGDTYIDGSLGGNIIAETGILGGDGKLGIVTIQGIATLKPGNSATGLGEMITDGVTVIGRPWLDFKIAGTGEGEYSQLRTEGFDGLRDTTPSLNVTLTLASTYKPQDGDTFQLFSGNTWGSSFPESYFHFLTTNNVLPLGLAFNAEDLWVGGMISIYKYPSGTIIKDVEINGTMDSVPGAHLVDDLTFNTTGDLAQLLINGSVEVQSGDINVEQGFATVSGGSLLFIDDMNKNGVGTLNTTNDVSVAGDLNVNAGTLNTTNDVIVGGDLNVNAGTYLINGTTAVADTTNVNTGATLGGGGILNSPLVVNNGTVSPGNSPGTLTVNGNFTQTSSGTLAIEVASGTVFDRLIVNGQANLGGTLTVQSFDGYGFAYGDQFTFLFADDINGAFDSIIVPNSSKFRGRFIENDGTGTLYIAWANYEIAAETPNQTNVARALNSFIGGEGDRDMVSAALDIQTEDQYPAAFDAIAPTYYESLANISLEQVTAQNQFVAQRLSAVRLGARGFSAQGIEQPLQHDRDGKSVFEAKSAKSLVETLQPTHWNLWVQGNGIFAKMSLANLPSNRFNSGGFLGGADYRWSDRFATGLYAGYQGTFSKFANGSSTTIQSTLFGLYGTFDHEGFYMNGIVGGAYNNYGNRRAIDFSTIERTARSDANGGQLTAYLEAGYDWEVGNFTFGPILSGQYTYTGLGGFTETGADSLDLAVAQQNANSIRTNLGGRIAYTWQAASNVTIIPEVRMFWQHEYLNGPRNISSALDGGAGPSFNYETAAPGRDSVFAGAGVSANFGPNWNAYFYYNANFGRQDYVGQMISCGLNWKF